MSLLRLKSTSHYPVLFREVKKLVSEYLAMVEDTKAQPQMFDGTFGGGGHSIQLLNQHKKLKVLGTDMDYHVLAQCREQYAKLIE
jgi:16S rRNA C1402 N4-methylase RsmH